MNNKNNQEQEKMVIEITRIFLNIIEVLQEEYGLSDDMPISELKKFLIKKYREMTDDI